MSLHPGVGHMDGGRSEALLRRCMAWFLEQPKRSRYPRSTQESAAGLRAKLIQLRGWLAYKALASSFGIIGRSRYEPFEPPP